MIDSQSASDFDNLLHRVVAVLNHTGTQEQTFDVVAPVELERQVDDFLRRKSRTRSIAGDAIDAVRAVVNAIVCEENLKERDAPTVWSVAMTNPYAVAVT